MRDGGKMVKGKYPPLYHHFPIGLQGTCTDTDSSRGEDVWRLCRFGLGFGLRFGLETNSAFDEQSIVRRAPEDSPGASAPNISVAYCVKEVWRAGCYMWEGGRYGTFGRLWLFDNIIGAAIRCQS